MNKCLKQGDNMDSVKTTEHSEDYIYIMKALKEISSQINDLMFENYELRVRNEELEKENKKLHETILKMSQKN